LPARARHGLPTAGGSRRLYGATLARAHARWGDRIAIASYLGKGDAFDSAIADFSAVYADQNERDYDVFKAAVNSGRLTPRTGLQPLVHRANRCGGPAHTANRHAVAEPPLGISHPWTRRPSTAPTHASYRGQAQNGKLPIHN
jgi:hypothetical protein